MQLCVNGTVLDALWISLLEKSSLAYTTTLWWLSTANPFPHVCSVQHMVFFNFLLENKRLSHALHLCCYSLTAWFSTSCFINLLLKKKTILAFWACCCTSYFFLLKNNCFLHVQQLCVLSLFLSKNWLSHLLQLFVHGTLLDVLWICFLEKSSLTCTTTLWSLMTAIAAFYTCYST